MVHVGTKYAATSAPLKVLIRQFVALNVAIHRSVDIPLPALRGAPYRGTRPRAEVTPVNGDRQSKGFVYLNWAGAGFVSRARCSTPSALFRLRCVRERARFPQKENPASRG